ncbi:MAG: hypothetical protein KF833_02230 [Verrucomicrobiae bacterium]|nr:hypothetical protein [Verrucomicrobiae bacterium]
MGFRFWMVALMGMGLARAWGHSAIEPVPRTDEWWQKRHEAMNGRVAELGQRAQVIFIGDSITQGWEGAGREVWERYYTGRHAINLGIGGDRTQHVLWRLDNGNLKGLKPKAAVVMIGTNNSNGEDNTVDQIADGVTAIVRRLREALPETKVLLLPIFPRSENPSAQRGKILQVNQILQKLPDGESVIWVDFGHRFIRANGSIPRDLMPDYLHLSPAAYGVWAESLEPVLARVIGDTPVRAAGALDLSGDWVATVPGPDQQPVDLPFSLRQEGGRLSGQFAREGGRWMPVEEGRLEGKAFTWRLNRARDDGSVMKYEMTGTVEGDRLVGKAKTEMGGNPVVIDWTARRR